MIRHILFWKYTDTVKAEHKEAEALAFLQKIRCDNGRSY